jgi:glycosyltransferase involved in cell wall biosynthesis
LRFAAAPSAAMVANSRYTAGSVARLAPRARVEVVHNPVDLRRWDPDRLDRRQARADLAREGIGDGPLVLALVAQLTPWKGQDTAVEALGLLAREGVDAHLLLIGSAKFVSSSTRFDNRAYLAGLESQVAGLGLATRVHFLGERSDVPELLSAADVLLLPSWEEPFGRALIEAMALRVPVVATEVGGPPEILSDGREGFLVPPRRPRAWAEALRRFARDPALAAAMGAAGRERVEREFSLERHVAGMVEVYRRALDAGEAAR